MPRWSEGVCHSSVYFPFVSLIYRPQLSTCHPLRPCHSARLLFKTIYTFASVTLPAFSILDTDVVNSSVF